MIYSTILIIILIAFIALYFRTGFLQLSNIDNRDLNRWEYEEGIIKNAKEFILEGSNQTCWYLIHGYTSTPDEMRFLAKEINKEFNETVIVTRLKGHGEVPSHILDLSLEDWYNQTRIEIEEIQENCEKVNVVGFSFGGTLSTRLSEEYELNNVYLIAPYLYTTYHFYYGLKPETYLKMFSPIIHYSKKNKIGQINSKEGLENHIAYWNMPFSPVLNSQDFIKDTISNLSKIKEPILIQHSKLDHTSDIKSSKRIIEDCSSNIKELILLEKSNHIILEDYDKEIAINNLLEFERSLRA